MHVTILEEAHERGVQSLEYDIVGMVLYCIRRINTGNVHSVIVRRGGISSLEVDRTSSQVERLMTGYSDEEARSLDFGGVWSD
ncbi:hypothetical protein GOBAR_AA18798 [Gossypium barbadense]|uniref:Uncharacterized protein n=1 Tax=Gossypium barbadense TaxID=3634 RepID=A0A2P5XET1_GOSBA|nr:hypothetical protein GOBAR_AA18798 [Gossypium barbadense]